MAKPITKITFIFTDIWGASSTVSLIYHGEIEEAVMECKSGWKRFTDVNSFFSKDITILSAEYV